MKVLHILRSEPDDAVTVFINALSGDPYTSTRVALYEGAVDWEKLVDDIFSHDRVISWW